MKIAALQMNIAWEDRSANYATAARLSEQAVRDGADIIVLPEMFATGFSMNTAVTAEPMDGETPAFLRSLAQRLGVGVIGGFVRQTETKWAENCALVVDRQGADAALYIKNRLFSYAGEDKHHRRGETPAVFTFEETRCTCFICYDLRFPELFRAVCRDVDVMFVIASWPAARAAHWKTLLPARAVENQCYVVGLNRVGGGDGLQYQGDSTIIDPAGKILVSAGNRETVLLAEADASHVRQVRTAMPFLNDGQF